MRYGKFRVDIVENKNTITGRVHKIFTKKQVFKMNFFLKTMKFLDLELQISLAVSDERSNNCGNSSKLHLSVPTVSYLPLISNQVRNHFKPENENSQLWFSFKGSPIRLVDKILRRLE